MRLVSNCDAVQTLNAHTHSHVYKTTCSPCVLHHQSSVLGARTSSDVAVVDQIAGDNTCASATFGDVRRQQLLIQVYLRILRLSPSQSTLQYLYTRRMECVVLAITSSRQHCIRHPKQCTVWYPIIERCFSEHTRIPFMFRDDIMRCYTYNQSKLDMPNCEDTFTIRSWAQSMVACSVWMSISINIQCCWWRSWLYQKYYAISCFDWCVGCMQV